MSTRPMPERIATDRLQLRRWQTDDAPELRALLDHSDAHLRPWIPFMRDEPRSLAATRTFVAEHAAAFESGARHRYAIRLADTGTLIGETMLIDRGGADTREAGYWLDRRHCGFGYATEATRALLPLAFDVLAAERIILRCDERNLASQRVAERLGARVAGIEQFPADGGTIRLVRFELQAPR